MTSNFAREIVKIAVIQMVGGHDFTSLEGSALDTMVDLTVAFIEKIAQNSRIYTELAGRTESNLNDLLWTFSEVNVNILDLINSTSDDCKLIRTVPRFPVDGRPSSHSLLRDPAEPLPDYIPAFFPSYPPLHTYSKTATFNERTTDPKKLREMKNLQRVQVENNLTRLHQNVQGGTDNQNINYDQGRDPKVVDKLQQMKFYVDHDKADQTPFTVPITQLERESARIKRLTEVNPSQLEQPDTFPVETDPILKQKMERLLAFRHTNNDVMVVDDDDGSMQTDVYDG